MAAAKDAYCWNLGCLKTGKSLKICFRCKEARYCSRDCQEAHWSDHKIFCGPASPSKTQFVYCAAAGCNCLGESFERPLCPLHSLFHICELQGCPTPTHKNPNARFCPAHTCRYPGCFTRIGGCELHPLCEYPTCRNLTFGADVKYCAFHICAKCHECLEFCGHTCRYQDCKRGQVVDDGDRGFCDLHICRIDPECRLSNRDCPHECRLLDCHQPAPFGLYCASHRCNVDPECQEMRRDCQHRCSLSGCGAQAPVGSYCSRHLCRDPNCELSKLECSTHRCSVEYCSSKLWGQSKFCKGHSCKTCLTEIPSGQVNCPEHTCRFVSETGKPCQHHGTIMEEGDNIHCDRHQKTAKKKCFCQSCRSGIKSAHKT